MSEGTERLRAVAALVAAFAAVAVPVVLGVVGQLYAHSLKERDVQAQFVELGVRILQEPPTEQNRNLRTWAIEVLNRYSGVPINEATQSDLLEQTPLPSNGEQAPRFDPAGRWVVQVGVAQSVEVVDQQWVNLVGRAPNVLGLAQKDIQRADLGARGIYYRLRAGYFADRYNAGLACDQLRQLGTDCIVASR